MNTLIQQLLTDASARTGSKAEKIALEMQILEPWS